MAGTAASHISHKPFNDRIRAEQLFRSNCILYFPPDRFEDPAWLNEANLKARAKHVGRKHIEGSTDRKVLNYSPLRDYDLTESQFTQAGDISGIVVVDEIDLHLHARHQCEILPKLMKMFPKVQFIVTSHSPLFVLGLQAIFGENGFGLYHLPEGQPISPEEFSEFRAAHQAFAKTRRHSDDIRAAVKEAQKPVVLVEGTADVKYLERAMTLLDPDELSNRIEVKEVGEGGGGSNLKKVWNGLKLVSGIRHPVVILHDCDAVVNDAREGNVFRRRIKCQKDHPISKGIENLLSRMTLQGAIEHKPSFIDKTLEHEKTERGQTVTVPEAWVVNKDEKTNLCNWLCENGTAEDFQHFRPVLEMLSGILDGEAHKKQTE